MKRLMITMMIVVTLLTSTNAIIAYIESNLHATVGWMFSVLLCILLIVVLANLVIIKDGKQVDGP